MALFVESVQDIETYVANSHPDFGDDGQALVERIQLAEHPAYGTDWSEWLDANIEGLREQAFENIAVAEYGAATEREGDGLGD